MQVIVVLRHQAEVRPQGHLPDWYAVQAGEHGVKTVADVGKGHPPAVGGIGKKGEAEGLVGAVGDKHILTLHPVPGRQRLPQLHRFRVGVEAQVLPLRPVQRRQYPRRRGIGRFIGVQLDVCLIPGLFPWRIGGEPPERPV